MKFIYADESGISANESVLIVAGVVIDADLQWRLVQQRLNGLINEYVPAEAREGYIFHAKDLFHGSGPVFNRKRYPLDRAHEALREIIQMPRLLGLPLVYGVLQKPAIPNGLSKRARRVETSAVHAVAFSMCAIAAEHYMKNHAPNEVATLVAENNSETQKTVRDMHGTLRGQSSTLNSRRLFDLLQPEMPADCLPITRIVDTVHHAEKRGAFLLQIADACALILRYAFEEKASAQGFIALMLGDNWQKPHINDERFGGFQVLPFTVADDK